MAEIGFTESRPRETNGLDSGSYFVNTATLLANGDTTPWTLVFEEFSVFVFDSTTHTVQIEMAFKADKSDAGLVETQDENERGANYEFTGYAWARVKRTAATGSNPRVVFSYRKD